MTETENKKIQVVIDKTQVEKELAQKLEEANKTIGKLEEANRALLAKDKAEFVPSDPKPAPQPIEGESNANLFNEPQYRSYSLDVESSDLDPSWIKGKNEAEVLQMTEQLAKKGNRMAQNALKTISRRSLKQGIDFQYEGNALLFNKRPYVISEFDSSEVKEAKQAFNSKWLKNRVAFRDMNGEAD